ncbi:hypothetical protein GCM10009798_33520 [Nocardioides panacihumi]|uniref:Tyr recombinase domain-containing protein n=1 Tax=Nocardioides panacihumi TaxID=400774 RepID=A0ABN2RJ81_9ACTN
MHEQASPIEDARAHLADELATRTPQHGTELRRIKAYRAWCTANGLSPLPADKSRTDAGETQLRRYLHSGVSERNWSGASAKATGGALARWFVDQGLADPRGARYESYLAAVTRATAGKAPPNVEAFTARQLGLAVDPDLQAECYPISDTIRAAAAAIACGIVADRNPLDEGILRLDRDQFVVRAAEIVFELDGKRLVVDAQRHAPEHRALSEFFNAVQGDQGFVDVAGTTERLRSALASAAVRAGIGTARKEKRNVRIATELRPWWDAAEREDRRWWLSNASDPHLARRLQDVAILLVGVATGHRKAEFDRLRLGRITETDDGYIWTLTADEHKGGLLAIARGRRGASITRGVSHDLRESGRCPLACPACALRAHLEVRRRSHNAGDDEPLFVGPTGAVLGSTGYQGALRRIAGFVDGGLEEPRREAGDEMRVSSRSLRTTAATLAYRSGMSRKEIADDITGHRQLSTVDLYIRMIDAYDDTELTLSLIDPHVMGDKLDEHHTHGG